MSLEDFASAQLFPTPRYSVKNCLNLVALSDTLCPGLRDDRYWQADG